MRDAIISILTSDAFLLLVMGTLATYALPKLIDAPRAAWQAFQRKLTPEQINLVNTLATTAVLAVEQEWAKIPPAERSDAKRLEDAVTKLNILLKPFAFQVEPAYAVAVIHAALLLAKVNGQLPAAPATS